MMSSIPHAQTPAYGTLLLKMAVVYLLVGLILGIGMAVTGQFQLRSVHTHVNLLGWVSLAITGLSYCLFPHLETTRLARWHVWLHNLGLPVMLLALTLYHLEYRQFEPLLGLGSLLTLAGLTLFGVNLFANIDRQTVSQPLSDSATVIE